MNSVKKYRVPASKKFRLKDWDPNDTCGVKNKADARNELKVVRKEIADLQYTLFAEQKQALLIVLQAMDTGGKDGVIRHTMSGVNPQGVEVYNFKKPSEEELHHDYLWRIHNKVPHKGMIGIFNRSHYEDVLIVRIRNLVPKKVWGERFDEINTFEQILNHNGTRVIKFYLNIDKKQQRERLQARIDNPAKHWKFNMADLDERKIWPKYMHAYEDVMDKCSTTIAPWFCIPANVKWSRDLIIATIIRDTLKDMRPKIPAPEADYTGLVIK